MVHTNNTSSSSSSSSPLLLSFSYLAVARMEERVVIEVTEMGGGKEYHTFSPGDLHTRRRGGGRGGRREKKRRRKKKPEKLYKITRVQYTCTRGGTVGDTRFSSLLSLAFLSLSADLCFSLGLFISSHLHLFFSSHLLHLTCAKKFSCLS